MSAFDELRDYFERLAIRRVLQRTLGSRMGEDDARSVVDDYHAYAVRRPGDFAALANLRNRAQIRREVEALCASVSASPDRRAR